ncbi:hypothetical protein QCA50_011746 [Cerrena zonata]|uniref:Uncharacterized protein n=1 Tax=Cerrena zonata TaxID=2478898 RepID=A0AAW0G5J2_9APHY
MGSIFSAETSSAVPPPCQYFFHTCHFLAHLSSYPSTGSNPRKHIQDAGAIAGDTIDDIVPGSSSLSPVVGNVK